MAAELPSVESPWAGGIFWKAFWFCHLESANWDELLLCYKGHLTKYRAVISLGPDGAKRSLCVSLRRVKQASVHFEEYRWLPGKEADGPGERRPGLSPAKCFSFFLLSLSVWPSLWLVKSLLNLQSCVIVWTEKRRSLLIRGNNCPWTGELAQLGPISVSRCLNEVTGYLGWIVKTPPMTGAVLWLY